MDTLEEYVYLSDFIVLYPAFYCVIRRFYALLLKIDEFFGRKISILSIFFLRREKSGAARIKHHSRQILGASNTKMEDVDI